MASQLTDKINFAHSFRVSKWLGEKVSHSCSTENGDISESEIRMLAEGAQTVTIERVYRKREYELVSSTGHIDEDTYKPVITYTYKIKVKK